jgi:hypothetical protein
MKPAIFWIIIAYSSHPMVDRPSYLPEGIKIEAIYTTKARCEHEKNRYVAEMKARPGWEKMDAPRVDTVRCIRVRDPSLKPSPIYDK